MSLLHSIQPDQIEKLKEIFAVFTPQGWAIPEWIAALEGNYEITNEPILHNPQTS